jgi:hypothetical protein
MAESAAGAESQRPSPRFFPADISDGANRYGSENIHGHACSDLPELPSTERSFAKRSGVSTNLRHALDEDASS